MAYHYSNPKRANDEHALPDIETWKTKKGWWYAFGLPGCMSDGERMGPFDSEEEALDDARHGLEDNES